MNRRDVNNVVVSLAGALATTNAEADQEIAALQVEVQQLRAALEQHRAVVKEARAYITAIEQWRTVQDAGAGTVAPELFHALAVALKGCP